MPAASHAAKRLSTAVIERLTPGESAYRVYDEKTAGLHVLVLPSGSKTWNLHYRFKGEQRRQSFGAAVGAKATDVKVARLKAAAIAAQVAHGIDPRDQHKRDRLAGDFANVAEAYLSDLRDGEVSVGRKRSGARGTKRKAAPNTVKSREILLRHAVSYIGSSRLSSLDHRRIDAMHDRMGRDVGNTSANRALSAVSQVFKYAAEHELVTRGFDPTRDVVPFPEQSRHTPPRPADYGRIFSALEAYEAAHPRATDGIEALRVLIFTGRRRDEVRSLRWRDIQGDAGEQVIACATKTGPKLFPVPSVVGEIFERQRARVPESCEWVFPSPTGSGAFGNLNTLWSFVRTAAALPTTRIHDLRHGLAVVLTRLGYPEVVVGSVLGHAVERNSVTARYAAPTDDVTRAAAERAAIEIATYEAGRHGAPET